MRASGWHGGIVEDIRGETAYLSVVFSWDLANAYSRAVWLRQLGYRVRAGGPAVALNPIYLSGVAECGGEFDALPLHNSQATFTSRGCPRKCPFCAVPRIEGDIRELNDWESRPIVCDNNLLACSRAHFDRVIGRLKPLRKVDFNQGLDARLLTKHHAQRLAELDCYVRIAWDHIADESAVMRALELLIAAGFTREHLSVYVLIGFDDSPDDALYRLEALQARRIWPNPMRYQPLDATRRNAYVAPGWTDALLKRYMRYWSRLWHLGHIPFVEYVG